MPSIIPDGATTSAPARAWLTACSARSGKVASLSTSTRPPDLGQRAAVAVVGVLAEADVGDDEQPGRLPLDRAGSPPGRSPPSSRRRRARARPCARGCRRGGPPGSPARRPRRPPRRAGRARAGTGRASTRSRGAGSCRGRRTAGRSGRRPSADSRGRGRGAGDGRGAGGDDGAGSRRRVGTSSRIDRSTRGEGRGFHAGVAQSA